MLENKVIVVTGGSGLIGKSIIKDIHKKGGVAVNADIISNESAIHFQHTDITSEASVEECINAVAAKFGRIDGLVNSAYPRTKDWGTKFEDITLDSWRANVDMQMNSNFLMIQKAIPKLLKTHGSIVNIASIYGVVGNDFTIYENTNIITAAGYSAIKGGIINLTRYLCSYYGRQGIRVNCVSPGGIFDNQNEIFVKNYEHKTPLGRMGNPEDIAPAVSFLLSEEAKYITGQNLIVDGGWTAI